MPPWAWIVGGAAAALLLLAGAGWLLARAQPVERRTLARRVLRLPWRAKARLAWRLARDRRVPLLVRAVLPLLVLYLVLPIDIIPDFIPVVGYLDDALVIAIAAGVLLRFAPAHVIDDHLSALEGVS